MCSAGAEPVYPVRRRVVGRCARRARCSVCPAGRGSVGAVGGGPACPAAGLPVCSVCRLAAMPVRPLCRWAGGWRADVPDGRCGRCADWPVCPVPAGGEPECRAAGVPGAWLADVPGGWAGAPDGWWADWPVRRCARRVVSAVSRHAGVPGGCADVPTARYTRWAGVPAVPVPRWAEGRGGRRADAPGGRCARLAGDQCADGPPEWCARCAYWRCPVLGGGRGGPVCAMGRWAVVERPAACTGGDFRLPARGSGFRVSCWSTPGGRPSPRC